MPRIEAALTGDNAFASAAAALALVREQNYQERILAVLPKLIRDPRPGVHMNAVLAAGILRERGKPLVSQLLELAENPPEGTHVQGRAIDALAAIVPGDERLLRICARLIVSGPRFGSHIRVLMTGGESAARLLADVLPSATTKQKVVILSLLGQLGPDAFCALDHIRPLVDHPDAEVAKVAALALSRIR